MKFQHIALLAALLATAGCDDHILGEAIITDTAAGNLHTSDWEGVKALFAERCETCHSDGGIGGFDLITAIEAEQADGDPSNDYYVTPGNAGTSVLWQAVSGTGTVSLMPPGSTPLSGLEINHIEEWIAAGAEL